MEYIISILETYSDTFKTNLVKRALTAMSYLLSIDSYTDKLSKVLVIDNLINFLETKQIIDQGILDEFFIILANDLDKYLLYLGITLYDNVAVSKKIELLEFVYNINTLDQSLSMQVLQTLETDDNNIQKLCTLALDYTEWSELDVLEIVETLDSSFIYALEEKYRQIEITINRQQEE